MVQVVAVAQAVVVPLARGVAQVEVLFRLVLEAGMGVLEETEAAERTERTARMAQRAVQELLLEWEGEH